MASADLDAHAASLEYFAGAKVMVVGVETRKELNGQRAVVESFVHSTLRWRCQLESGELVTLKRDSLRPTFT